MWLLLEDALLPCLLAWQPACLPGGRARMLSWLPSVPCLSLRSGGGCCCSHDHVFLIM